MRVSDRIAGAAVAVALLIGISGCAVEPIEVTPDTVIIDVRTADEYVAGHLDGAINIDIRSDDFIERISELPMDERYLVYCASGNRSGAAVAQMTDVGFTDLVDAGGMSAAAEATGIEVVTGR